MQEFPDPWGDYARLQASSSQNSTINSYSWGVEEEMNVFLTDLTNYSPENSKRLSESSARRERSRNKIRRDNRTELTPRPADPVAMMEARETLRFIESKVTPSQWRLLLAIGDGCDYRNISLEQGVSVGAARTQVFRLRQQLTELRLAA